MPLESPMLGGYSGPKEATEPVKLIANQLKKFVEEKLGRNVAEWEVVQYRSQVVNGTNYIIKVHVGGDEYIHLKVYEPLPVYGDKPEFVGVKEGMKLCDTIEYFE